MDDLESRLSSVLGDAQQMEKLTKLAQSILSSGEESAGNAGESGIEPELIGRLSRLWGAEGGKEKGERALLEAMSPYLSEKRRGKMDRALKLAKLARIAKLAIEESGGNA